MAKASYLGKIIAESDTVETVEGNIYFPRESVNSAYVVESPHTSVCGWKGTARYYHVEVDGQRIDNAAWYYPEAKTDAKNIENHVAFWNGVLVEES